MSRTANVGKGRAMQLADNLLLQYVCVLIAFKIKHCLIMKLFANVSFTRPIISASYVRSKIYYLSDKISYIELQIVDRYCCG